MESVRDREQAVLHTGHVCSFIDSPSSSILYGYLAFATVKCSTFTQGHLAAPGIVRGQLSACRVRDTNVFYTHEQISIETNVE